MAKAKNHTDIIDSVIFDNIKANVRVPKVDKTVLATLDS